MGVTVTNNNLLTVSWITREALRLFRNSNWFLRTINREFDDEFGRAGRKIGDTLRIRVPNDYIVRIGSQAVPQGTSEQQVVLTLATQAGVDMAFSSADRALSLDDFSRRVIAPAVNKLAGKVASDIMAIVNAGGPVPNIPPTPGVPPTINYTGTPNLVWNEASTAAGQPITPTAETWLAAGAVLDQMGAPRTDRFIVMDPLTQARTVTSLMGLFNPQVKISGQYMKGTITTDTLGFDWGMDQTVQVVPAMALPAPGPTVAGDNQTGSTLNVSAVGAGGIPAGTVFTITGVNSINRVTNRSNGVLQQFVVTQSVIAGTTALSIYPPIIPPLAAPPPENPTGAVPYQTVTNSPAGGAQLNFAMALGNTPGGAYRANFAYYAEAVTMATAELDLPRGVHEAYRETYDGISMRVISDYAVLTDQFVTRLDILYGAAIVRPEWVVRVADAI